MSSIAIIPRKIRSFAIYTGVFPLDAKLSEINLNLLMSIFNCLKNSSFPKLTSVPFNIALMPNPEKDSNILGSTRSIPTISASFTIASPSGCSDAFSAEAAKNKRKFLSIFSASIISVTTGFPFVIVPVLSNNIVFT